MNRRDPLAGEHDIASRARAEKTGMVLRQLDESNPALSIMNFDGSHAKGINSGTGRGSRNDRRCARHNQSRFYTQSYQVHENGGIPKLALFRQANHFSAPTRRYRLTPRDRQGEFGFVILAYVFFDGPRSTAYCPLPCRQ